ncbi:hypothetical protein BJ956_001515 [Arthrobacter psychrochitiniphilus]|nr:hypothetical protein [Arthrobacter psychrochitiniphilus]
MMFTRTLHTPQPPFNLRLTYRCSISDIGQNYSIHQLLWAWACNISTRSPAGTSTIFNELG